MMRPITKRAWLAVLITVLLVLIPCLSLAETGTLFFSLQTPYQDDDRFFEFEVQLNDEIEGTFGDLCFIGGRSAFTLSQGQSVMAPDLPEGLAFTLRPIKTSGYVVRFCNLDGYIVSQPRGRIRAGETNGIVVAEINTSEGEKINLETELQSILSADVRSLTGENESDAQGKQLPVRQQGNRTLAGPLTVSPGQFHEYGEKGKRVYRYQLPSDDGRKTVLNAELWMLPGESMRPDDDEYAVSVSIEEDGISMASTEEQGSGWFVTRFRKTQDGYETDALERSAELKINGEILLIGRELEDKEFLFTITEDEQVLATAKNTADGSFAFPPILFTKMDAGQHRLVVRQEPGTIPGMDYDLSEIEADVVVTDNDGEIGAGLLRLKRNGSDISDVHFENRLGLLDFRITNLWQGGNEGKVEFVLYANGVRMKKQPEYTVDGAVYTYHDLPVYDENGNRIVYSARELYVDDYMAIYVNKGEYAARTKMLYNGGTVINRKVKDFVFSLQTTGGRIDSDITFTLYCNGRPYYTQTQPEKDGLGRYIYRHLPIHVAGKPAVYTVVVNGIRGAVILYPQTEKEGTKAFGAGDGGTIHIWFAPATGEKTGRFPLLLAASLFGLWLLRKKRLA